MKKTIFALIFAMMLGFAATGCQTKAAEANDSTSVDTVLVDSAAVDSVAADSIVTDTIAVAE